MLVNSVVASRFLRPEGVRRVLNWAVAIIQVLKTMATSSDSSVSFEETDTRHDEMHSTIKEWIDDLVDRVDDVQASEEF